jgi:hypothetical protein
MTTLELNKTYTFDLGDMSHCGLSHEEMIAHYQSNSSPLSFLVEKKLAKWFDNLTYDPKRVPLFDEDGKPYCNEKGKQIVVCPDLTDDNGVLYDQKAINHKGGSYSRSSFKGVARTKDKTEQQIWAEAQVFIWTDFTNLPEVKVHALTGSECIKRFPSGNVSKKEKDVLFG